MPHAVLQGPSSEGLWVWFHALLLPTWNAYWLLNKSPAPSFCTGPTQHPADPWHAWPSSWWGEDSSGSLWALLPPRWHTINLGKERALRVRFPWSGRESWSLHFIRNVRIGHWCTVKLQVVIYKLTRYSAHWKKKERMKHERGGNVRGMILAQGSGRCSSWQSSQICWLGPSLLPIPEAFLATNYLPLRPGNGGGVVRITAVFRGAEKYIYCMSIICQMLCLGLSTQFLVYCSQGPCGCIRSSR